MDARRISLLVLAGALGACGAFGGGDGPGKGHAEPGDSIEVTPSSATLQVVGGSPVTQAYVALLRHPDGSTEDVTSLARFTLDRPVGEFAGAVLTAAGSGVGVAEVSAALDGVVGTAQVSISLTDSGVRIGAPADAPSLFGAATEDDSLAPTIVYPAAGTVVPPNLGDFEVHYTGVASADLYEVHLASQYLDYAIYTSGSAASGAWLALDAAEWQLLGGGHAGADVTVTVRALSQADPSKAGSSSSIKVILEEEAVRGGIYYWAAASASGAPKGIYRHDFGSVGQVAEQFYTTAETTGGKCVACHGLSRDGKRMTVTFDGGDGASTLVDVATGVPTVDETGTFHWNFASWAPGGDRFLAAYQGAITIRDGETAVALTTVATGGYATQPDWSPTGDRLVYVRPTAQTHDWLFTGGSLVTRSYNPVSGELGEPVVLVPQGTANNYYPSFSPDGEWILFNRSASDAYDDVSAELWVVRSDGSSEPVKLDAPNVASGLTNSWPRWAPFEQGTTGASGAEPVFWLTFSSKRAYGVRIPSSLQRPQLWMAPFYPERTGSELSAPAFRLPFQAIDTSNHIAQWTESIVAVQ